MMNDKQWSQAELARRSGLSRTSISYVISGQANPGDALCRAIAKAFQIPIDDVYRVAGLLPVKPNADETVSEITHIYHELDEDNRQELLDYARLRLNKQEREQSGKQHSRTTPHRQST